MIREAIIMKNINMQTKHAMYSYFISFKSALKGNFENMTASVV